MEPALYLIPVTLGETELSRVLPAFNAEVIPQIRHFIVEDVRSARRFLKKVNRDIRIDDLRQWYWLTRLSAVSANGQ